nr:integrase, catalytic region, zinc finger, CCHC-type, peptidase aspartic, catalytic [Tanacetum cinerariifolium]
IATACFTQNPSIIHLRFTKTPNELINGKKPDISFLHVFGALCYPKNDGEDIGKLGAKGDIGFFIGYTTNSCAFRICNRRTKKIIETMNVLFDELSAMAFEQRSLKPELQSYPDLFMVRRLGLFQAHDRKSKASHQFRLEVYGNCHNLFSVEQFCGSDLEVAFRRNYCFVRNLEGVDLLKGDRLTNLYIINLHEIASASPICLMACASSTKSWLWHQWLSHLNFDTINDLARNDLVSGVDLLKEDRSTNLYTINLQEMASVSPICLMAHASSTKSWLWHQRLSHLNFDTINDLARNDLVAGLPKFKYHKEHLCPTCEQRKSKRASHPPKPVPNLRQRLHLLHMDLCGPMRIASINGKRSKDEAPEVIIKFLKRITLGAKGDIGFFIGYSVDSCAYIVYNQRTKKIMETMNVSFNELSAMAFEQRSSKPGLNDMTFGHISSGLDLTDCGRLLSLHVGTFFARIIPPTQDPQVCQLSTASTTIADIAPIPTNSSSHATNILISSHDVDELNPNAMVDDNTFINPFANPSTSAAAASSSQNMDPSNMHTFYQPYPHEF